MPRHARKKSNSGIYHVMLRGINGQSIFEDEYDKKKFIETLKTYKTISEYKIFAYCLMSNQITQGDGSVVLFTHSTQTLNYLTAAFLYNYERSGSYSTLSNRQSQANFWYNVLT